MSINPKRNRHVRGLYIMRSNEERWLGVFADKVEIEIRAGKGGDGKLSFLHEKYRAYGGADGGEGVTVVRLIQR